MAGTDSSTDRDLPPLPGIDPTSRGPSTQSLFSLANGSTQPSEYRSSLGRERSSRESRRSVHSEIELRFGQIHTSWQAEKRRAEIAERRAEDAERKLQELAAHLKAVNDARLVALRDAGRANEELKLYRVQLEHAQQEIYRAQDIIGMVDRQRHSAEQDAANHRNKTRQLQKTVLIQLARDEAYKRGLEEGLARGRELGTGTLGDRGGGEEGEGRYVFQGEYSDSDPESRSPSPEYDHHAYPTKPRSIAPSEHSRAPTRYRASPLPVHPPLPLNPPNPRTSRSRVPSLHQSENNRPISVRVPSVHPSENIAPKSVHNPPSVQPSPSIRPISMRNVAHTPRMNNAVVPPDNLIPSLDADNRIRLPPPFGFHRTPERPTSELPQAALSDTSQEALPIRPRSNSNATTQRQQQSSHHTRNSSSGSNSSTLSALDIVNNPFNAALRTPMSIIPEVNSAYSGSPQPQSTGDHGDHTMYHQRSVSDYSAQRSQAPPSVVPADRQSQYTARPHSRSSYAGSWVEQQRDARVSSSTIPNIDIQPPSKPVSQKTDSLWGGVSGGNGSPAMSQRAPLPSVHETPQQGYPLSTFSGMPGGYINADHATSSEPPIIPRSSGYDRQSKRYSRKNDDDDAVSSSMSADTLTTPPAQQQSMEADWSGTLKSIRHPLLFPYDRPAGSSSTAFWDVGPESEVGTSAASVKSKKKSSKGSVH